MAHLSYGMALETIDVVDYVVVVISLLICVVIGVLSTVRKKTKVADKVDEYLLANRSVGMLPAAFSIMATIFSSNSIAGNIGELYVYGISNSIYFIGATALKIFAAYYIIPVFHNLPYVSIYEYLEMRFDRSLRVTFAILYIVANYVYLSAVLYGPAISLATVTPIPYWANAVLLGGVCTLYCVVGGLKAVVWTDVFQALLMFACVMMMAIQGMMIASQSDNFGPLAHQMANSFWLTEGVHTRYTVWGIFISSLLATFKSTVSGQAGAQRLLAVKDHHVARRSVYVSCFMMCVFDLITLVCAFAVYVIFSQCDPLQRKAETGVKNPDQMFIYSVAKLVGSVPGLRGIALAGLLSASLSTCSSYLNSFATIVLQDIFKVFCPTFTLKESTNIKLCKFLTFIFGVLAVLTSFAVPYMGGIIKVTKGVSSAILGPLAGIMAIAFFLPKVNATASKVGLFLGISLTMWVTMGSLMNPVKYNTQPLSTEACPADDVNGTAFPDNRWTTPWKNESLFTTSSSAVEPNTDVFSLYAISFVWYGPIGMGLTCATAIILSFIMGNPKMPADNLLSPLVIGWRKRKEHELESTPMSLEQIQSSTVNLPMA